LVRIADVLGVSRVETAGRESEDRKLRS
jgi:hypothetical protein